MLSKWVIYYDDGSIYTSEDGPPFDGPGYGVIAIWQQGHDLLFNKDFYLRKRECWLEVDMIGLVDQLVVSAPLIEAVKVGRVVSRDAFKAIMRRVNAEHP